MTVIILIGLAFLNLHGMSKKCQISSIAFGFCLGLAAAILIDMTSVS